MLEQQKTRRIRFFTALICAGLGGMFAAPALAQSSVKILVNNEPITSYDIKNRTQLLKLISGGKAGQKLAIEELINERLKIQEAKRVNMSVTDARIESAYANIAKNARLSPTQLSQALRQNGINPKSMKDRIRAEMVWGDIVSARFRATVNISDQEVARALKQGNEETGESGEATGTMSNYRLQPIIFIIPAKASKGYENQRQKDAEQLRERYAGCQTALQSVKGMKGVVVQNTTSREESQLPPDVAEAVNETPVGKLSKPTRISEGLQLFGVCFRETIKGATKESSNVRRELMNERGNLLARRYLRDLRSDAVIVYRD